MKTVAKILKFQEILKNTSLSRTKQLRKKVTPEQLAERLKLVYNNDGMEAHDVDGANLAT